MKVCTRDQVWDNAEEGDHLCHGNRRESLTADIPDLLADEGWTFEVQGVGYPEASSRFLGVF